MNHFNVFSFKFLLYILLISHIELARCSELSSRLSEYGKVNDDSLTKPLLGQKSTPSSSTTTSPKSTSLSSSGGVRKVNKFSIKAEDPNVFSQAQLDQQLRDHIELIRAKKLMKAKQRQQIQTIKSENKGETTNNASPTGKIPSQSSSQSSLKHLPDFQPKRRLRGYIPPTLKDVGLQPTTSKHCHNCALHSHQHTPSAHEKGGKKPNDGSPTGSPTSHNHHKSSFKDQ